MAVATRLASTSTVSLEQSVRLVDQGVQPGQRAAGDGQRDGEDDEPLDVVAAA